jgi:cobalt-zinc-cadmium efflux system membrane fusion protein
MRQILTLVFTALLFAGVGVAMKSAMHESEPHGHGADGQGSAGHAEDKPEAEFERGPHRGRMLRDGDFALEITIFEEGVPPEFHVYAFANGKPLPPSEFRLAIDLGRLGNRVDKIAFAPESDYLKGDQVIVEPHSFDVKVRAERSGKTSEWSYQSYEGRTQIAAKAAETAGIQVEKTGPAKINDTIELSGVISLNEDRNAQIGARFPGFVKSISKTIGDEVAKGETIETLPVKTIRLRRQSTVSLLPELRHWAARPRSSQYCSRFRTSRRSGLNFMPSAPTASA